MDAKESGSFDGWLPDRCALLAAGVASVIPALGRAHRGGETAVVRAWYQHRNRLA
ncbi:MAG: hypothetical protein AAFN78_00805 [Pseudomonadota bacterium]